MDVKPIKQIAVSINDQIAVIKRRLMQMENSYPRLVKEFEMTKERADNEIARYRAVLDTLLREKVRVDAIERGERDHLAESLRTVTPRAPYDTTEAGTDKGFSHG